MLIPKPPNVSCDYDDRRADLLDHPTLNGIDYVEIFAETRDEQRFIHVYFIHRDGPPGSLVSSPEKFTIEGGARIRDIDVVSVTLVDDEYLLVEVDKPGDFSTYTLVIEDASLDPAYARVAFSFKAGCPSRFDCKQRVECPPEDVKEPIIDYMARDYESFRTALLNRLPQTIPQWTERNPADSGIMLLELVAYLGDELSYFQDAVANEAYLESARQRESVRRHARLIDYHMHDGVSARTYLHVALTDGTSGALPAGTTALTRIDKTLRSQMPPHPTLITPGLVEEALEAAGAVFETVGDVSLHADLNEITVHDWGQRDCCLPRDTTYCYLRGGGPVN